MTRQEKHQRYYTKLKQDPTRYDAAKKRGREYAKMRYDSISKEKRRLAQSTPEYRLTRKEIRKKYRKKHVFWRLEKLLARKHDKSITRNMLWSLCKKQRCRCALTGEKLTSDNVSCDHILPTSRGGIHEIKNLQLTTLKANLLKNNMLQSELISTCESILRVLK